MGAATQRWRVVLRETLRDRKTLHTAIVRGVLARAWLHLRTSARLSMQGEAIASMVHQTMLLWRALRCVHRWQCFALLHATAVFGSHKARRARRQRQQQRAWRHWRKYCHFIVHMRSAPIRRMQQVFRRWWRYSRRLISSDAAWVHGPSLFTTTPLTTGWVHWLLADRPQQDKRSLILQSKLSGEPYEDVARVWQGHTQTLIVQHEEAAATALWGNAEVGRCWAVWQKAAKASEGPFPEGRGSALDDSAFSDDLFGDLAPPAWSPNPLVGMANISSRRLSDIGLPSSEADSKLSLHSLPMGIQSLGTTLQTLQSSGIVSNGQSRDVAATAELPRRDRLRAQLQQLQNEIEEERKWAESFTEDNVFMPSPPTWS